VESLDSD
jgi:hypothetical protein